MNNRIPEISIVIPVYNIVSYLEVCINSILEQSFTDYEVILVDDGSSDGSSEVCDKFDNNPNFKIIHTENAGPAHARNTGLELATGKYIAFIDGDDAIADGYLEILYKEIEKQGAEIVSCCCKSIEAGEEDHFFSRDTLFDEDNKIELIYQLIEMRYGQPGPFYYTGIGVPWGKLYNRAFIENHHLRFDNNLRRLQDNMFNMYAFHKARNIKYINKPLYLYRRGHVSSLSVKFNPNLARNSMNLIHARTLAMDELGYSSDDIAVNKFHGEAFKYYREILKNIAQYYPHSGRYKLFSKVFYCKEEYSVFKEHVALVEPADNWTVLGRKLELWLVRHHMCTLLYVYLRTKKTIKSVD